MRCSFWFHNNIFAFWRKKTWKSMHSTYCNLTSVKNVISSTHSNPCHAMVLIFPFFVWAKGSNYLQGYPFPLIHGQIVAQNSQFFLSYGQISPQQNQIVPLNAIQVITSVHPKNLRHNMISLSIKISPQNVQFCLCFLLDCHAWHSMQVLHNIW